MTDVTTAGPDDQEAFLGSVIGLFREDAGTHDPAVDVDWPVREGPGWFRELLEQDCLLAVARDGDRVVGHLVGKLLEPDDMRTRRFAVLESVRVDPAVRGGGVGSALVEHFLGWAEERGAEQASVTAYAANAGAQRLYQRYGFRPQSVTLRAALRSGAAAGS